MLETIITKGSSVEAAHTSSYTIDTSISNTNKLTIKSVSSNDFTYSYECLDASVSGPVFYFAQITNGSSTSRI